MSRIGKQPIEIPGGVTVEQAGADISVKGPKGLLSMSLVEQVDLAIKDNLITITPKDDSKTARSMWGMQRTLVSNLIEGVTNGYHIVA